MQMESLTDQGMQNYVLAWFSPTFHGVAHKPLQEE